MLSIIVAIAHDNVIGRANDIPWYIPADLKYFKTITTGHTVIMGRKTYDSIAARIGGPLPNRHNVVVTREESAVIPDVTIAHSLEAALSHSDEDETFIIGGAEIYAQSIAHADRLYVTHVDAEIADGDTFFPRIDPTIWREVSSEPHKKDERNEHDYTFTIYEQV